MIIQTVTTHSVDEAKQLALVKHVMVAITEVPKSQRPI